ncbi:MAG: UDP-N-acetylmuramoyl-L-alanine--D-glutamate ligase [Nitrospiraceae bacterium]|nr:UDP-N-acetylmuramoyl-L-alanine--D-glutamate ligase [Nitrospiraceae bacterium]
MDLNGMKITVFGLKRSGRGAVLALHALGADVSVTDSKKEAALADELEGLPSGIKLYLGGHPEEAYKDAGLVVISPGVPSGIAPLRRARELGIKVAGELEVGFVLSKSANPDLEFYAITGTNGKSTTTVLLHRMLESAGKKTVLAGNIGHALTGLLDEARRSDSVVVEVSSFQLETIHEFRPRISAILNIAPDHMDRYHELSDYAAAKMRIFENQTGLDYIVLNAGDPGCAQVSERLSGEKGKKRPRVLFFGKGKKHEGVYEKDGVVYMNLPARSGELLRADEIRIKGVHNLENAMAAACMALLAGVGPETIRAVLMEFPGLEHRIEITRELDGVTYINDSKGTNPPAALRSIESFGGSPLILIAGGRDKNGDFESMRDAVKKHVKLLVLMGEAAEKMSKALSGATEIKFADSLAGALRISKQAASPGDIVLLSPACASFDMFKDFEDRGRKFKEEVAAL